MENSELHEPVLVREVVESLHIQNKARYIDATVGTAGHSIEIVRRGGEVLGIDMDKEMLEVAKTRLEEATARPLFKLIQGNFRNIDTIAKDNGFDSVSGILFDLGVSNIHLTSESRGFSFANPNAPFDMRLDPNSQGVTAADLLNVLRKDQLTELFAGTMERGSAGWLAKRIVKAREISRIETMGDFLNLTRDLRVKPGLNPATLSLLAIRIAVNSELENLAESLPKAFGLLNSGGRLVVISFHSGEDRIVKNFFREKEESSRILTEKPITATEAEIQKNPRSRSAKMRVLEKL